jgi:hypothetical protein
VFVRGENVMGAHTALLLHRLTVSELKEKLNLLLNEDVHDLPLMIVGPRDITVIVSDELISNWADSSVFDVSVAGVGDDRRVVLRDAADAKPIY